MSIVGKAFSGIGLLVSLVGLGAKSLEASKLTVFVYNYAAIPSDVLAQAEAEAARIYVHGGIEIQWLDCPLSLEEASRFPACQVPPGPTTLALRILSESMAQRARQPPEPLGFALFPDHGSFATIANVFGYDAEQLANRCGMQPPVILGYVAAHELGHLLLGVGSHSSTGIMHVPWNPRELEGMAQGRMMFTSAQTRRLRTNFQARIHAAEESNTAVVNIHLYNLAGVSTLTLGHATQVAARVLATAGVDAVCWDVLADAPEAHTLHTSPPPTWRKNRQADSRGYIIGVIVRSVPVDYFPGALGYALPDAEIGVNAMIFFDRIERFRNLLK